MKSTEELLLRIKEQPSDDLSFLDEPDYNCLPDSAAWRAGEKYKTGYPDWDEAYRVLCCLKESGDKKIYLLEERNGLKRLICKIASDEQAAFLKREYEILEKLSGIWRFDTLKLKESEKTCALLRDYVDGITLAELVRQDGVLDLDNAARLGIEICRVLEVLHHETPPVIHRDLKPENLLVTPGGRVRLIDFETARFHKPDQDTDTVNIGTRGYAPPEQFGYGQTDFRTDVYAVGKILEYMVTGKCGKEAAWTDRRGKAFGKIIRRCCAYDPSRRYADAEKLKRALRLFLERRRMVPRCFWPAAAAVLCLAGGWGGFVLGQRAVPEQEMMQAQNYTPGSDDADLLWESENAGETDKVQESGGVHGPDNAREADGVQESEKTQELGSMFVTWNPSVYQEDVDEILRFLGEGSSEEMAAACETLVKKLRESEALRRVDSVAFWELDEKGMQDYYASRQGYEFIADQLAYKGYLTENRLGTYKESAGEIARKLRTGIEYVWTNEDGSAASSVLHQYVMFGDDRNMDGCILEILEALNYAMEQTEEP